VPVRDLIEKQRTQAVRILSDVVKELKEEDKAHEIAFREKKLRNSFNQVLYAFEKISGSSQKFGSRYGKMGR
jgi:Zn-dependent M32 family carboxypeptidase